MLESKTSEQNIDSAIQILTEHSDLSDKNKVEVLKGK